MDLDTSDAAPESSLRDTISEAFEQVESAPESAPKPQAASTEALTAEEAPNGADKAGGRDKNGRFAQKPTQTAAPKAAVQSTSSVAAAPKETASATATAAPDATATATPAPVTETLKAPQSWKPDAREEWAKVPQTVQREIARREREAATALQESSGHRRFADEFSRAVGPYEGMIRAEGGNPMTAIATLLQTAAALRTAPSEHKAKLVAGLIRQYNVPIDALDAVLSGQPAPQGSNGHQFDPNQLAQQIEQRIMGTFQQQRSQALAQKAVTDLEKFAADHEFYEDVRQEMADLMDVRAKRGISLSPEQAYNLACSTHPEISGVLKQREAASQANASQASTQRIRAAGSSVRSQPAGVVNTSQPNDIRGALEGTIRELSNR